VLAQERSKKISVASDGKNAVRASTIVMIGFAIVFGVLAVFVSRVWLNSQANKQAHSIEAQNPVAMQNVVVAAKSLGFGTELTASLLREQPWPAKVVPPGSFSKISDLLRGGRRVVLSAIAANEPVLALKVTGPGQRATLSALVKPGMKAETIRVNDVDGVGGFVLPGDHVDILLTRRLDKGAATTEVVLQNIKVLAIDQIVDDRGTKAKLAKSATLEVSTIDAQKLTLASSVGSLSLLLRQAGDMSKRKTRMISLKDLMSNAISGNEYVNTTVVVTRPSSQQSYTVPVEGNNGVSVAAAERRQAAW
jgi:pilus assembly protein CpaB